MSQVHAQIEAADSAVRAAKKCEAASNRRNAAMFWRLAATHLEQAARMVPHKRGIPTDAALRESISTRYRAVLEKQARRTRAKPRKGTR